jgi:riboflavin kinase/FMN adenylyltransferase
MTPLRIVRRLPVSPALAPSALTIGNLDGVHRGHLAMLERVRLAAQNLGLCPSVTTFTPHPKAYFAQLHGEPARAPRQICGLRDKLSLLAQSGMQQIALLKFDAKLANLSADEFIDDLLIKQLKVRWLQVGSDFRFGHRRGGDVSLLQRAASRWGFELEVLQDIVDSTGHRISSSTVRDALTQGDLKTVSALLGRAYQVCGHVIHGKKLGRTLGFPTLNLRVERDTAIRFGIYVVKVHGLGEQPLPGIASLGLRPTVDQSDDVLLETHILDRHVAAYGKLVQVELLQHVRDEQKFPDLTSLTAAMQLDRQHAADYFAQHGL